MKTVQERIAAFPKRIVVDLQGMACETRYGVVDPGERGYQPLYVSPRLTLADLDAIVAEGNDTRLPTPQEREAALVGSMFGWDCPGADPERYTVEVVLRAEAARKATPP